MSKRKTRIDSADGKSQVLKNLTKQVSPPEHIGLEQSDLIYFENVISEFAKSEWSEHQLEIAGMLARTMADLNREQKTLREEGFIAVRENGTTVENPRSRVVKSLTGDILSLRRSLALHTRARGGSNHHVAEARKREKDAEKNLGAMTESDLLAKPICH